MTNKSTLCAAVFAVCVCGAVPAVDYTVIEWRSSGGVASGSWTDADRWSPSVQGGPGSGYPGSSANLNQKAVLTRQGVDYTVAFPAGDCTNAATLEVRAERGRTVTLDASRSVLTMPALTGGTYGPFVFETVTEDDEGRPTSEGRILELGNADTAAARGVMTNVMASLSGGSAARPGTRLEVSGDIVWTGGAVQAFGGTRSDADGSAVILLRDGSFVSPESDVRISMANYTNVLTLSNFDLAPKSFSIYPQGGCIANEVPALFELNVENGSSYELASGEFILGYGIANKNLFSTNKTFRINVSGGSTFAACVNGRTLNSFAGNYELNASGAGTEMEISGGTTECLFGTKDAATTSITVSDGAQFVPEGILSLGGATEEAAKTSSALLLVTNAAMTIERNIKINNGEMRLIGADVTMRGYRGDACLSGTGVTGATATFVADGSVLHLKQNNSGPVLKGFDTAKLGSGGLSVFSEAAFEYEVPQAFSDLTTGGTLTVGGYYKSSTDYPLTLSSADSRESNLVIARRTVVLAEGANHYSHVTVTNGATFSLAGGANAATLRGLTLGDDVSYGTLALDVGDVVTVEGEIALVQPRLTFTTTLAEGSHTVFRRTTEPGPNEISLWETRVSSFVTAGLPSSGYVRGEIVHTDDLWEYRIVVEAAAPELSGSTSRTGGGAWQTGWSDGAPDATMEAVFSADSAQTVTVPDAVDVAALEFGGTAGVTLTGGKIRVSENSSAAISVTGGDHEISSRVQTYARIPVDVAEGATLALSGSVYGGFEKTGAGRLDVACADSAFPFGFALGAGWLCLDGAGALGVGADDSESSLSGGTLETTGVGGRFGSQTSLTGPVVFKTESGLTMSMPKVTTTGAVVKRGEGRLVFEVSDDATLAVESAPSGFGGYAGDDAIEFPADGSAPGKYHGLTVLEGETVVRGTGEDVPKVTLKKGNVTSPVTVGGPLAAFSGAHPGLVIDHAHVVAKSVRVGTGVQTPDMTPYVVVTNGGVLQALFNPLGNDSKIRGVRLFAHEGRVIGDFIPNSQPGTATNICEFVNNSHLSTGFISVQGHSVFSFDRSLCGLTSDAENPFDRTKWTAAGTVQAYGSDKDLVSLAMSFANGSVFSCGLIRYSYSARYSAMPVDLEFDGSEWWPGEGLRVLATSNFFARTVTTGGGLIQHPAEGSTYRWVSPVVGDGGFVKRGAGTVRFDPQELNCKLVADDPVTLGYAGLTDIREGLFQIDMAAVSNFSGRAFRVAGTLDILGGTLTDARIAAAGGSLANGTYANVTIVYDPADGAALTVDGAAGAEQSGRAVVDFVRAPDEPLEIGSEFTVAVYTGGATPPTRWRARNLGDDRRGRVSVANGTVNVTVEWKSGMMLLVR